jgi:hypothetical protein
MLGEDRPAEGREGLRRPETPTCPADEQGAGYASIRQGSE